MSAAVLYTEAAPWPSIVQRAGRCNRDGQVADARLLWAPPWKPLPLRGGRRRVDGRRTDRDGGDDVDLGDIGRRTRGHQARAPRRAPPGGPLGPVRHHARPLGQRSRHRPLHGRRGVGPGQPRACRSGCVSRGGAQPGRDGRGGRRGPPVGRALPLPGPLVPVDCASLRRRAGGRDLADQLAPDAPPGLVRAAAVAGRLHDIGKVHQVFQVTLEASTLEPSEAAPTPGLWHPRPEPGPARRFSRSSRLTRPGSIAASTRGRGNCRGCWLLPADKPAQPAACPLLALPTRPRVSCPRLRFRGCWCLCPPA